jgi:hypothetical protein
MVLWRGCDWGAILCGTYQLIDVTTPSHRGGRRRLRMMRLPDGNARANSQKGAVASRPGGLQATLHATADSALGDSCKGTSARATVSGSWGCGQVASLAATGKSRRRT